MASIDLKTLARIVRIPPSAWDAIFPHGPIEGPHPEPWRSAVLGAGLVRDLVTSAAQVAERGEGSFTKTLLQSIDDWCGTGYPGWRPKPKRGGPIDREQLFLGALAAAVVLADSYDHNPEAAEALAAAAELLAGQVGHER